ncbi:MAG: cell division protein FtsZ [Candidatus Pacearchaeota archaeon]|nr:cell division protein FtsZ [Candidatus Pacearchaeota archaeon]
MAVVVDNLKTESEIDKELASIVQKHMARIKVIGCGGAGNNSVTRMKEIGISGCEIIAVNTDAQDLLYTNSDVKILIGRELTHGLGAGSNPKIGEKAALESEIEIKRKLEEVEMVFVTCGLGGGTGTGASPVIAEIAKKMGALTIGVVTLPFSVEGQKRIENAQYGLNKLLKICDTLIVIPNDKLLEIAPELPMHSAFKIADEILTNAIKGITEMITKAGLVNLDFADLKAVMTNGGLSLIGIGESNIDDRARDAVERAINNPLMEIEIMNAKGALVNVIGGSDMSLEQYKTVIEAVSSKVAKDAKIISGAQIVNGMEKMMRVLLVITGVNKKEVGGILIEEDEKLKEEKEEEIIDFMEEGIEE